MPSSSASGHAGWSPFPLSQTPVASYDSSRTSSRRSDNESSSRRPSRSGNAHSGQVSHHQSQRGQYPAVDPVRGRATTPNPPSAWKTATSHQPRSGTHSRGYVRPVSSENSLGTRSRATSSAGSRSDSAQSYYSDAASSMAPLRSSSRNEGRATARSTRQKLPAEEKYRRKPLPAPPLRPRPSSPILREHMFEPLAPRAAPKPPQKHSHKPANRTSMSVDTAGNPRSFWDTNSEGGSHVAQNDKPDLLRTVRSWNLGSRKGVAASAAAMGEKDFYTSHALRSDPRAPRRAQSRHPSTKRQSSAGWRELVLCC